MAWGDAGGACPPLEKIFKIKVLFLRFDVEKKENFQLLHVNLAVFNSNRFFFLRFFKIYTFNNCKINDTSQFCSCVRRAWSAIENLLVPCLISDIITRNKHLYIRKKTSKYIKKI